MKNTLTTSQAAHLLLADDNANWSYKGAHALVEYLEELEAQTCGNDLPQMEFDRVAIRCDFSEYGSLLDWAKEYHGTEYDTEAFESCNVDEADAMEGDLEAIDDQIREYIRDHGQLVEFDGGIIVSSF